MNARTSDVRPSRSARSIRLLRSLPLAAILASTSGCMVFVHLPVTPGLENLSEGQVFSMAPPSEWPAPLADNPQTAAVDVACGFGPRLATGQLYAAVSVKGRPPTAALPPLNVALVLDRSGIDARRSVPQHAARRRDVHRPAAGR